MKIRKIMQVRGNGEKYLSGKFYAVFSDHQGAIRRIPLFDALKQSVEAGRKITLLVNLRAAGETMSGELAHWIEATRPGIRDALGRYDIIPAASVYAGMTLAEHLKGKFDKDEKLVAPGWLQHLTAGRTDRDEYAALRIGRVLRVFDGLKLIFWRDLRAGDIETRVITYLGDLRTTGEIKGRTFGYYVRELKAFCRWMVEKNRAVSMALAGLKPMADADADSVNRRELSPEEIGCLLESTASGATWEDFDPAERALLYRFAFEAGLRPGTIRKLQVGWFELDAERPAVVCPPGTMKRRREHRQALRPAMVARLRTALANKVPTALAFRMPDKFTLATMLRADLAVARDAWIAKGAAGEERLKRMRSDFLADVDHHQRRADFYSLRHSHGSAMAAAGVPQKDIQASLHHSKSSTTDRYMHSGMSARADAVGALPEFPDTFPDTLQVLRATGTDPGNMPNHKSPHKSLVGDIVRSSVESGGIGMGKRHQQKTPEKPAFSRISQGNSFDERDGTRTRNHRIDSPLSDNDKDSEASQLENAGGKQVTQQVTSNQVHADELSQIVAAWPSLPEKVRKVMLGIVRSAGQSDERRKTC